MSRLKAVKRSILCMSLSVCMLLQNAPLIVHAESSQGWKREGNHWRYYDENSQICKNWVQDSSGWYYLDKNTGYMQTSWLQDNGSWYFLNPVSDGSMGKMMTGWQWIDGYCYYFEDTAGKNQGAMYAGRLTPDGYKTDANGHWTDAQGKEQYIEGKGISTKAAQNKTAVNKTSSRGGSGGSGGRSRGNKGNNNLPETDNGNKDINNNDANKEVPKPQTPEDKPYKEEQNVKNEFMTLADYASSNILTAEKTDKDNLAAIQEKVYKEFTTVEEKENLYFLELDKQVIIVDLNNKLLGKAEDVNQETVFESGIYYAEAGTDNMLKKLDKDNAGNSYKLLLIAGEHKGSKLLSGEYMLGLPDNRYNASLAALDNTKELAGINFVSDSAQVAKGANASMIALKSNNENFDCVIDNNSFVFKKDDAETQLYRAIGIYSVAGNLKIKNNHFEGQNIKNGAGSRNIHGMIDCQARLSGSDNLAKQSFIQISNNTFKDIYSAGIILYASEREGLAIEDNVFSGSGEEAIKITPVIVDYPKEHNISIRGNTVSRYGLNENTGYTDGGFGGLGPVNTGEHAVHLSYYGGVQCGSKLNGHWSSSTAQLENIIKLDNNISSKEENDANPGVLDSVPVKIGQKGLYIDTAEKINDSDSPLLKDKSPVIVKDRNGDVIYGQDPENPTAEIRVKDLYITGESSGIVTLPATLHISGNLKVDLPNGFVKSDAVVEGQSEINSGKLKNSATFTPLDTSPVPRGAAVKDYEIKITDIRDDEGNAIANLQPDIEVLLGSSKLDESQYSYSNEILSIRKETLNKLARSEKVLIRLSSKNNNLSRVSSQLILIEISNLSAAEFIYSNKRFSHLYAEEDIRVQVKNLRNNKGEAVSADMTKLKGNVEFRIFGKAQDAALIDVDDDSDTIILSRELLNYLYATRYEASPDKNQNFGMSQSYELVINDREHHIYDVEDTVEFEVIDRSGVDFVFEKGMTFTQGEAPEEGITLSVRDVINTRGEAVSPSLTVLKDAKGNLNMNVEPFPVQRDDTDMSELLVLRDEKGEYIREVFNPRYLIIDDENDTITFTKEYLDRIQPGKDSSTEKGIKTFVFKYTDTDAKVDVRSRKIALHIKLKEKALSSNIDISFKDDIYRIEGDRIVKAKDTDTDTLIAAGFLKNLIKHNPRQQVFIMRDTKVLRSFDALQKGDKLKIIAEDGVTEVIYSLDFDTVAQDKLYENFNSDIVKEIGSSAIIVNKKDNLSIRKLIEAIELSGGVSIRVVNNSGQDEYEPVVDSTLTKEMTVILKKGDREYRFEIRFEDGTDYRALLIGNQDYGNPKMNLAGPENDLRLMNSLFKRMSFGGERFEKINVEKNLKKAEFLSAIEKAFAGATHEDVSYIYYSGHGYNVKSNKSSYICTVDRIPENTSELESAKSWVSVDELKAALDKVPGTKVVILDCCNAGGFIGKEFVDSTSGATPKKDKASSNEEFIEAANKSFESNNTELNYLTDREYKVLVASSANEYSYEEKQKAIGKFTVEFVAATEKDSDGMKADENEDDMISLSEMYDYLMDNVESISHIQAFPQMDDFAIIENVDSEALNSSTLFKIKNSAYTFESRIVGGKTIGTVKSNLVTIDEAMTAEAFLSNIEKAHIAQSISVVDNLKQEYSGEQLLKKGSSYLRVVAEDGTSSQYPIVVERVISDEEGKSIIIKSVPAKGIKVEIDEGAELYAISLEKSMSVIDFVSAVRAEAPKPKKYFKLLGRDGKYKELNKSYTVESGDKLEVTSNDKSVVQNYNITVLSEGGEQETDGDYIVEGGVIKSGTKRLSTNTKVGELLKYLSENGFDLTEGRATGIYAAGTKPPFGMKKHEQSKLAEGDRLIIMDFEGRIKNTYDIELADEDIPGDEDGTDKEKFDNYKPDFGESLSVENNKIKSSALKLNNSVKIEAVLSEWKNAEDSEAFIDMSKSGIYKGAVNIIGGEPNKPKKSGSDDLGYGDKLIIFYKSDSRIYKSFEFEMEDESGGGDGPIIIPPVIVIPDEAEDKGLSDSSASVENMEETVKEDKADLSVEEGAKEPEAGERVLEE